MHYNPEQYFIFLGGNIENSSIRYSKRSLSSSNDGLSLYLGFGLLLITAFLSYLPYTQIWIYNQKNTCWLGSLTNRGKINLEIEFENLIREIEKSLFKTRFKKDIKI